MTRSNSRPDTLTCYSSAIHLLLSGSDPGTSRRLGGKFGSRFAWRNGIWHGRTMVLTLQPRARMDAESAGKILREQLAAATVESRIASSEFDRATLACHPVYPIPTVFKI